MYPGPVQHSNFGVGVRYPPRFFLNGPHERSIVARKLQTLKVYHLLNSLTLGELQSRTTIERPSKPGRKPKEGLDLRPIIRKVKIIKGTGIPASTLKKIQEQKIQPRTTTIKKLVSMYHRLQYQRLRAVGANQKDARKLKSFPPDKINSIISKYKKSAQKIQHNYETAYYDRVKEFKKSTVPQKPKKLPPIKEKPIPEYEDEEEITSVYSGTDTYLDEDEPEAVPETFIEEIKEPPLNDYPSIDEIFYGMSISEHDYNEWEDIADTSGLEK